MKRMVIRLEPYREYYWHSTLVGGTMSGNGRQNLKFNSIIIAHPQLFIIIGVH